MYRDDGSLANSMLATRSSSNATAIASESTVTPRPNNAEIFGECGLEPNSVSLEILERLQRLEELISDRSYGLRGNVTDGNDLIRAMQHPPLQDTISTQEIDILSQMHSDATDAPGVMTDIKSLEMVSRGVGVTVFAPVPIYLVPHPYEFDS